MSQSAFSAKVFAVYLFFAGVMLAIAPNLLLATLHIPQTSEVWIRVLGVVAFVIGVYAWIAASHAFKPLLVASVYTRCVFFLACGAFTVTGLANPMIMLFGVADLAGGIWTHLALRADAASIARVVA